MTIALRCYKQVSHRTQMLRGGYVSVLCEYCGTESVIKEVDRSYIERYLRLCNCPTCGAANSILEKSKWTPPRLLPDYFSGGLELEFKIPDAQESLYFDRMHNRLNDHWGVDGYSPYIKEYRSNVIVAATPREVIAVLVHTLRSTVHTAQSEFNATFPYFEVHGGSLLTFGIHISLGGRFLMERTRFGVTQLYDSLQVFSFLQKEIPHRLLRRILVSPARVHEERIEYRSPASADWEAVVNALTKLEATL